jgi:uncharacterized protein YraI
VEPPKPTDESPPPPDAEPPTATEPPAEAEKEEESPVYCAVCGQPNPPDRLSCQSCAKRLSRPVEGRSCPYCSALNVYGARFCWRCGMPLTGRGTLWWALTATLLGLAVSAAALSIAFQSGLHSGNDEWQLRLFFTLGDLALAMTAILLAATIFSAVVWRRVGSALWTLGSMALASVTFLASIPAILLKTSLLPNPEMQTAANFTPVFLAKLLAGLLLLGLALRVLSAWRPALAWGCLLTLGLGGLCYGGILLAGGSSPPVQVAPRTPTLQARLTATPIITPTFSLTPSPTAPPTPAPTATSRTPTNTPTPVPEAIVAAAQINLRTGPGANYDIIGQLREGDPLDVLGRNRAGDWLEVAPAQNPRGWVSLELVELNIAAGIIPVSSRIPPTPTPLATPTATRPPLTKDCPPNPALVEVSNRLSAPLTISLTGPEQVTVGVLPGETGRYCLMAGSYLFTARAPGYTNRSGTQVFASGECQCWAWEEGVSSSLSTCSCENDVNHYLHP